MLKKRKQNPQVNTHSESPSSVIPTPPTAGEESLKSQVVELDAKFKRALADYQNQEKRFQAERSQVIKFANESLLTKLLAVLDDLERAQNHLKDPGLGYVIKQLMAVLESEGLTIIDSLNQDFDPLTMDCVEVVPGPKDKVIRVVSAGFKYYDRVIRPAKVEVGNDQPN